MGIEQESFLDLVLGGMTKHQWIFAITLMYLGIFLYVLKKLKNRKNKDKKISFNYYFTSINNIISILISIIVSYISIRFYADYKDELISKFPTLKISQYFAMFILGFFQHKIVEYIVKSKKKKITISNN